ncbi:MAG: tryptophan 7-halogenase [Cellvibrio sp.]
MNNSVKKVAIVGRDADAWITALVLQQAFASPEQKIEIELIELTPDLGKQDFFSVLPSHKVLHKILGANERLLLKEANGHYCFAQRFSNWSGGAAPFVHAYDRFGVDFNNIDFYQYWLKAKSSGMRVALEDFNLGAVAAKQGRYAIFDESTVTFSQASYGFHLSATDYIKSIAKAAIAVGVKHSVSNVVRVNTREERIDSVLLADGKEIRADFFIDASGTESLLIKTIEKNNIQSWSQWLPANRIMVATAPSMEPLPAYSQVSAFKEGWFGIYPLLNRTAINIVYSSQYATAENMYEKATILSGLNFTDATETLFSAGTRTRHWIGNCLAIGSSAVSLEPLDAIQLHPLHIGLSLLKNLFPNDIDKMPEADIYNQKMRGFVENMRDFQIAHYYLNKRYGDPYWDKVRAVKPPSSLEDKMELFASRGVIALSEDETFAQENWTALFAGHGLETRHYTPLVNQFSDEELIGKFQQILKHIKDEVARMPSLQAHVEMTLM